MPKHRKLLLTEPQRQELIDWRDHAKDAYLRERCAALLGIADGAKAAQVARSLLLKPHKPDTIYDWLDRYVAVFHRGTQDQRGARAKARFFPCSPQPRWSQRGVTAPGPA